MASSPTKSLVDGATVTKSIRLVRQLGRGGMGTIWLAEHAGLRTRVVVKFMDSSLAADPDSVARFSREAAAAATVRSPHVVQIFDHGVSDRGLPFIVMEHLEGNDLGDHLADVGRMPAKQVGLLVAQTAKALSRAHSHGIVHRDIKPENIFLCDVGAGDVFVKLLDFGLAKKREGELTTETRTGATMGTPFYMSPEQIVNPKEADPRADLWALAVVAFECLTGFRPFDGETVGAIAVALHSPNRPRATDRVRSLPPEIDVWFARAFATDPDTRFRDAQSMAAALREILTAAPHVDMPPMSTSERRTISRRRKHTPSRVPSGQFEPAMLPLVEPPSNQGRRRRFIPFFAGLAAFLGVLLVIVLTRKAPPPDTPALGMNDGPRPTQTVIAPVVVATSPSASAIVVSVVIPSATTTARPTSKPGPSTTVAKPTASAVAKKKYVDIK